MKMLVGNSVYVEELHENCKKLAFFMVMVAIPKCQVYKHLLLKAAFCLPKKKKKNPQFSHWYDMLEGGVGKKLTGKTDFGLISQF